MVRRQHSVPKLQPNIVLSASMPVNGRAAGMRSFEYSSNGLSADPGLGSCIAGLRIGMTSLHCIHHYCMFLP